VNGTRREARERALALLYEADSRAIAPEEVLVDLPVAPDPYATALVTGVGAAGDRIDALISRFSTGWRIERMPVIDRALVRLATFELLERPDVPTGVVISEAVDLAGEYSTDESSRFVNGLLARIAAEVRSAS